MATPLALVWDLIAKDSASPAFLRVAGAADKAATATERSMKSIEGASARMSAVGAKMTKGITLPLLGIGAVAVDQAAKFQKSMTLIQTAGGETAAKTAIISAGIKKVAVDTGTSLSALSDGIYTVAKAGAQKWSATDQLLVLKAAAQGAKAENVDLGTAVSALTSVMQSYGVKAKDAVGVENELIKGSGLAKTSFGEFTGSLSNFVPLASSLHISLAQVTGALATMTQHGESAQQSGQNLNNLIRNLAGGNTVASKAMQQLNIDTVSLRKNLSENGLTGTLNIVENALAKNSKGGLVVVDAFKRAQLATGSLTTELNAMPSSLQSISKQFETGHLSYKDYYADVKQLGGTQFELGKNFITTMAAAKGFSDQLKSGNGTISTAAQQLQKMLGGATGLNVALMLGGNSAKQFSANVDQIAAAANKAGVNVLGWGKTSQTLSVQLDKAKENLQVLAVEIGTALIPAVTKIASAVSNAVHSFSGLSSTQKEIAAWSAGLLFAIGPVLAIGGRLAMVGTGFARFATGAVSQLARFNTSLALNAQGVSSAMGKVGSALGGAAIGFAVGELTKNASTATKAIGVLGSAAAGAAIGFGSGGGGIGAVIGGVAGGLTALATSFFGAGSAAKAAVKPTDDFTQAMLSDKDAIGANTRAIIENNLEKNGSYDAALKLGISQKTLTDATMGNASALADVNNATLKATALAIQGAEGHKTLTAAQERQVAASGKLIANMGDLSKVLQVNKQAADNLAAADGKSASSADQHAHALDVQRAAASLTVASLKELASLKVSPKIKADPSQAAAAVKLIQTQIDAIRQNKNPKLNADSSAGQATIRHLQSIINSLKGKTVPVGVMDRASAALIAIKGHLDSIQGKTIVINTAYRVSGGGINVQGGAGVQGRASGGGAPEGWFAVGEQGAELVHKSGNAVQIFSNAMSRSILAATGMKAPGFAAGSGPTVDALASRATAAQIKRLNDRNATPSMVTAGTGKDVANSVEDKQLQAMQDVVAELRAERKALITEMRQIGPDVADALNGVSSKSHQKARAKK